METKEIPIGESRSSANVNTRYVEISQSGEMRSGLTVPPSSFGDARFMDANVRIPKPMAATNMPRPILRGAEGSLPFFANAPKMASDTGVNATTKNGLDRKSVV